MKAFSSKILSEGAMSSFADERKTISSIKESEQPMLYRLLEFNEAAAEADVCSTKEYYHNLLNMLTNPKFNYDDAFTPLFNQYEAVRVSACDILNNTCYCPVSNNLFKTIDFMKNVPDGDVVVYRATDMPAYLAADSAAMPMKHVINGLIQVITDEHKDFNEAAVAAPNLSTEICKYVSSACGCGEADNVDDVLSNYTQKFAYKAEHTRSSNIRSSDRMYYENSGINANFYELFNETKTDVLISLMRINTDRINLTVARSLIKNICDGMATYAVLAGAMRNIADGKNKELANLNISSMANYITGTGTKFSLSESLTMFGDEIDAHSMFEDLDPEDFNPTDFMDLSKISEHVYNMDKLAARKEMIVYEAKYLAEGQYDNLASLHEAMGQKIKEGLGKLIEAVKKIISRFIADIMGIFAPEKVYLQKYKNIILNSTIPEGTTVDFEGHALEAMERLRRPFKIPTTSYNTLIQKPEQFENEDKFFEVNKAGFGIGGDFKRSTGNDAGSLADDLKVYWGFKDEKNKPAQLTFKDINPKIKDIYNFLLDTENEAKKLNTEVKNIDRTYRNYLASAKQYGSQDTNGAQVKTANGGAPKVEEKQEYYSFIADRYIPIDEKTTIGQIQQPSDNNQQANDNNQGGDNNQQNNDQQKTNTNLARGDTDAEVKKSGDTEDKIARNMEIYTKTCRTVITARATGFRFCHQELMAIMKAIVKAKLGDKADIRNDQDAQKAAEAQKGKEPPATSKTPQ